VELVVFEQEAFLTKKVAREQQMSIRRMRFGHSNDSIATAAST
jgi:hypothetical protein